MNTLYREPLGLIPWITASWFLFLVVSLLLWFSRRWGQPAAALRRFLVTKGALVAPGEVLAFLYAVGTPYVAILLGFLDPQVMGLSGFGWWETLGQGALLGAGLLLAAGLVWGSYLCLSPPPPTLLARSRQLWASPAGRLLFLPWAAAEEAHWAFYRTLPMLLWGAHWGLWAGLLLIASERYANPRTSAGLRRPGGVEEEAWWWTRLVVMTAVFAVLRNLWLCVVLHAMLEGAVAWMVQRRAGPVPTSSLLPSSIWREREEPAAAGREKGMWARPIAALAVAITLAVLLLFTAQAAWPLLSAPTPVTAATALPVPTPTPPATPHPTPPATTTPTPAPQPTATTAPTPTPMRTYVVQEGDTLKDIAAHFHVSVADLMQANGITDADTLQVGQVLIIP